MMRYEGIITRWDDKKGFGFITPTDGGADVFVHVSQFRRDQRRPRESERVTFSLTLDERQRRCATDIQYFQLDEPARIHPAAVFSALFLLGMVGLSFASRVRIFGLVYVVMSGITALAYWDDKKRAIRGAFRTSEAALHVLELVGGWPGALIAQVYFRHKNRKVSFQVVFWSIVVLHLSFWGLVFAALMFAKR